MTNKWLWIALLSLGLSGCQNPPSDSSASAVQQQESSSPDTLSLDYEKYQLDNGLTVILHQDKSDPLVAVSTLVHVGSSREKPGRTGFAHFFEHMAFNDSENVPQGANRKMIEELGGSRNGGTWSDATIYYEVVPKDAFEKVMWIDSDRLGYMINTVTEGALEREKQVVKNEKRQRVDNRPYGHTDHVIRKNLYPEGHPYSWTVIGELDDLQAATLSDVKEFYQLFYGPANATLVIAGDIDIEQTKAMVETWFGEIKASEPVPDMQPMPVQLDGTRSLYHLDKFARVPELRMTLPTVEDYHPDSYALAILGEILSLGKRAPLYKAIVEEGKLAPGVSSSQDSSELAGTFTIRVRANAGQDLDAVKQTIHKALQQFEQQGFSDNDLKRIKARQETSFYRGIASNLNKAFQLGVYEEFAGDPGFVSEDIRRLKAVTREDVMRVYQQYIKDKPYILTSFVPHKEPDLIVDGAIAAQVKEEAIVEGAEQEFDADSIADYNKTPTLHDRSEPPLGEPPVVTMPEISRGKIANGMTLYHLPHNELPIVEFILRIESGAILEAQDKLGQVNLLGELMNEGTANRTPEQLEDAIGLLGASISVNGGFESVMITGTTLARNFESTMDLVTEMLLEPRFDEAEFERLKARRVNLIQQSKANPSRVASTAFYRQLYGTEHRVGMPTVGTMETISELTLEDMKTFYQQKLSPQNASLHVVGDITEAQIRRSIKPLTQSWQGEPVAIPALPDVEPIEQAEVFFIDIPGAKQSVIMAGKPAMKGQHPDYYPFYVAQNRLGGGSSARLFQTLRIEKGYTYGAYSGISRRNYVAPFVVQSQVRANVTLESLQLFRELIGQYDETYTQDDLDDTRNLLLKGNALRFETTGDLVRMMFDIDRLDLPLNFLEQDQKVLQEMPLEQVRATFKKYGEEQQMHYIVVGDAETQLPRVREFSKREPILLDRDGKLL
ncbi:M16 family metallopeptidase [Lacimicrobium alkaliphilum]|uniref:Peptidase M16 n=1 Tax=Lacimicrobium alkaliphilum TaxID=1526571 RepID=A0ABQ1RD46_9ALTE|nr:pitrilysin family protein [Lacimicrobium alkaliphilum]GGD66514.1 peptidase M16 [Lacimicrobium alkaliphilum]